MKSLQRLFSPRFVAALSVFVVLAFAGTASAHPGIYTVTAKVAKTAEQQTITINATGGTFKPSAAATAVAYNATAFEVQVSLDADPAVGFDNVAVTGNAGGPYTLTYQGAKAGVDVAQVVPDGAGLTGGAATAIAATTVVGGANVVYPNASDQASQLQAVIANDGYAVGIRETNGLATGGMLNFKVMPTAYRAAMTSDQRRTYGPAQSSYQLHATCQGVAALSSSATILGWQQRSDGDPFYNYIPFQKTSAGVGDDPTSWIPVVQTATGVNLSSLSTVGDFTTACQGLGGTYVPADTLSNITTAAVADGIKPVQAQVDSLTADKVALQTSLDSANSQISTLQSDKQTLDGANAALQGEKAALASEKSVLQSKATELQTKLDAAAKAKKKQDAKIKSLQKQIKKLRKH